MADLQLVVIDGPNAGTEFDIAGSTVIGRDPSSGIVLDDAESSRRHASVSAEGDAIVVEDLGSTNGTYVAGERIEGSRRVGSGDRIRIGTTVMEVRAQAQATAFAPVPEAPDAQATQIGSLPPVDEPPPPPPVPEAPEAPAAFEPPAPPPPPPPPEHQPEPVAFSEPPPPEGATEIGHAPEAPADDGATELRPIPGGFEDTPNEGATEMRSVPSFEPQGESTFAPPPGGGGGIEPPADATFAPPPGGGGGIEPPADATFAPPPGGGGSFEPQGDATYAPPPGGGAEPGPPPPPPGGFGGDPGAPPPPPPFSGGPPPPPPGGFGGPESGPPPPPAFGTPPSGGPGYAPPGGGPLAPPAFAGAPGGPMPPKNPVAEWLLSYFVPFYSLYWFHRSNKELEAWSGGRVEYNATSSLLAITLGWLIIVPPFVAWSHYMERIREGQRMAGLPQTANFWGSVGRAILILYNVKWHQEQFNEIGTRPPQY